MILFNQYYMAFDHHIEPYQKADDVGYVISEFLWFEERPFYPVTALAQARVARVNLTASRRGDDDEDNCDLIFQMPKADGGHFYEIVMRSDEGTSYGGWACGERLETVDIAVNGYRQLRAFIHDSPVFFQFSLEHKRYMTKSEISLAKAKLKLQNQCLFFGR